MAERRNGAWHGELLGPFGGQEELFVASNRGDLAGVEARASQWCKPKRSYVWLKLDANDLFARD